MTFLYHIQAEHARNNSSKPTKKRFYLIIKTAGRSPAFRRAARRAFPNYISLLNNARTGRLLPARGGAHGLELLLALIHHLIRPFKHVAQLLISLPQLRAADGHDDLVLLYVLLDLAV